MPEVYHDVGTVQIGAESYQLVREEGKPWGREFTDEPPWAEGVPAILSEPSDTWHHGGLKSRPGFLGTSEYGVNTDCRWPGRILPGPKVTTIELPLTWPEYPTGFFEALGRLWVCAGRCVHRIDPADDSVVLSKDFLSTHRPHMGLRWEKDTGLVCDYVAGAGSLWEVTALGTPDTWTQGAVNFMDWLAVGTDRLFGVITHVLPGGAGELKNIVSGLDPLEHENWSGLVQCGDISTRPTGIVAYGKTVLVGKPEGVFGVNAEGLGIPLVRRIMRDDDNFKGMMSADPFVILPHSRGVYRWMPGYVESVGIETELLNEAAQMRGKFTAFAVDGKWLYGALAVEGDVYIMIARDRAEGEAGFGPYIWDTLVYKSGIQPCQAMWVSNLWDPPRLFFASYYWVDYIKLSAGGGAPDVGGSDYRFATSGIRVTHRYSFGDWEFKDFPKAALTAKGITANEYWELYYSVDGGAWSKLDIDGNDMKLTSNGRTTFYLPQSAVGREIQYYFNYTGTSETAPAEIVHFEPFAVPQSRKVPVIPIMLRLAEGARSSKGVEHRTAQDQLNDLITLSESPTAIALEGPWGDISGWLRKLRVADTSQVGHGEFELIVEAVLQRREES